MDSSTDIRFRRHLLPLLLALSLVGACLSREAPLPLPVQVPAPRSAVDTGRRAPVRHELSLDFYAKTCPAVDQIVANFTAALFRDYPAAGPAVLRLYYHDCFVEAGGPYYAVKKGRKDSKVSLAGKVSGSLPRANSTVDELLRVFASKGLGVGDLVALSGAHTVGFAHCVHFVGRLYDFRGTRQPDPVMDARLLKALRMSCPCTGGSARVVVPFDVSTPFQFDHAYYANLQARLGVLASDQALFLDARTRPLVQELGADKNHFFQAFAASMDRMGSIRVKKGRKGEIRKVCSQHLL